MSTRQDWDAPPAAPRAVRSPEGRRAGWIPLSECPSALGSDFRRPRRPEKPRPWFSAASVPPPVQALSSGCGQPPWGVCVRLLGNHTKPRPPPPPPPATSYANRRALHGMRSAVPGVASPGPRPCPSLHDGGPPARPPSIWRHRGPVAAPWPRSAWPGHHCPPRQAHSLPLGRPDSAPPALTPPPAPSPPSLCLPPGFSSFARSPGHPSRARSPPGLSPRWFPGREAFTYVPHLVPQCLPKALNNVCRGGGV